MIYPKFYHCDRFGSDLDWILKKLAFIPESKRKKVCIKYEKIYLNNRDRKKANLYLYFIAYIEKVKKDENKTNKDKTSRQIALLNLQKIKKQIQSSTGNM